MEGEVPSGNMLLAWQLASRNGMRCTQGHAPA